MDDSGKDDDNCSGELDYQGIGDYKVYVPKTLDDLYAEMEKQTKLLAAILECMASEVEFEFDDDAPYVDMRKYAAAPCYTCGATPRGPKCPTKCDEY